MIGIILSFLLKIGVIIGLFILFQKIGVFKALGKFFSFLNTETIKKQANKSRIQKLKHQLRKSNRLCDEL